MSRSVAHDHVPYRICLALAPILMGVALFVDLSPQANGSAELLAVIDERPDRWRLGGTLFLVAGLAWLVAGIGLQRVLGGRSRLIGVGGLALAAGGLTLALLDAAGLYLPGLIDSGASLAQQISTLEAVESSAVLIAIEVVHVLGWVIGMVLVSVGLWRSRAVPRWVPALLLASLVGMVAFTAGPPLAVVVVVQVVALLRVVARLGQELEKTAGPPSGPPSASGPRPAQVQA